MLELGWKVTLAGEGSSLSILTKEFPHLPTLTLKGYRISYPKKGFFFIPKLMLQVPKLFKTISLEQKWLEEKQTEHNWDIVISDNRYGLSCRNTKSIFITHQLYIISGWGKLIDDIVNKKLHQFIRKFNQCWIPDQAEEGGIAEKLSHPPSLVPLPSSLVPCLLKYLGPLSRLTPKEQGKADKILILLSGPEPQRTLLEEKILEQIKEINEQFLVVRGLPNAEHQPTNSSNIQFENHLTTEALSTALSKAKLVICRSGYSSIMDLLKFKKKAVLIPTPGQTEQLYLAKLMKDKNWFCTAQQHNFQLKHAIPSCLANQLVVPSLNFELHKQVLAELVTQ
jgi:UDP-N-acetylglucosamine transferase subunit ALG13